MDMGEKNYKGIVVFPRDQENGIPSPDQASETAIPREGNLPELNTANFHLSFSLTIPLTKLFSLGSRSN